MPRESADDRKKRARRIARKLARACPEARTALRFESPFQLLIATILSAQCTDEKVNEVTRALFAGYPTPRALAEAPVAKVEQQVHATGFFRQKARSIQGASRALCERFGGEVPADLEALVSLPGVARKTANVVLGNAFGKPGIPVDTHVKRVSRRLGLTRSDDPVRIEEDLMALLARSSWIDTANRLILHGRQVCLARRPRCADCVLRNDCPAAEAAEAAA